MYSFHLVTVSFVSRLIMGTIFFLGAFCVYLSSKCVCLFCIFIFHPRHDYLCYPFWLFVVIWEFDVFFLDLSSFLFLKHPMILQHLLFVLSSLAILNTSRPCVLLSFIYFTFFCWLISFLINFFSFNYHKPAMNVCI